LAAVAFAQVPCWETNFGANQSLADDGYSTQPLPFTFPFAGINYTDITICSNGFLWPGAFPPVPATSATLYQVTLANFLTEGPRIAPLWNDFDPTANPAGGVYFNTFPAVGLDPARAVITWDNVYEYAQTTPLSMQITLTPSGDIHVHYDTNMALVAGGFGAYDHIVGASDGSGVANPVSFSTLPITTSGNATMHEVITRGAFPLVGKDFQWIADGTGGYIVIERVGCSAGSFLPYGAGCPKNMTAYEFFSQNGSFDLANTSIQFTRTAAGGYTATPGPGLDTGYSNAIVIGDDQVIAGNPLGFSFPIAGTTVTTADISSNGVIWLGSNPTATTSGYPSQGSLVAQPVPCIAPLWMDLDPGTAGTVYWDADPVRAMMTWENVPFWNVPTSSNTFQVKLLPNGDFVLSWLGANNDGGSLVGVSEAGSSVDPGPIDWSASLPLSIGQPGLMALTLAAGAGSRPAIGTTFNLELGDIPSGTALGAMILSLTQLNPGLNLGLLGMQGCTQYVTLDTSLIQVISGATATFGLPIPNDTNLLGVILFAQGGTFSAGFNSLGVIVSNGGEIRVGT